MQCVAALLLLAVPCLSQMSAPTLRLPSTVSPLRYEADLRVVPGQDRFSGIISIEIALRQPASIVWLHAKALQVQEASITSGGKVFAARAQPQDSDFLGLATDNPIGAGKVVLRIAYSGEVSRSLSDGLFQQREGNNWYVFSKFEPVTARRAFPCFDEPSFKTPWKLTLHVPKGLRAFSNTPVVSEADEADGMTTVRFAESKPLPSYLVALAVGPLDAFETAKVGKNQIPSRIVVARGRTQDAAHAASITPQLIAMLESYFGIPYPYEKLDQEAVPLTTAWGAMENAGLIAYAQQVLLAPAGDDSELRQRRRASTMAHEISHQWFGDLVTMAWWDDLWLNEAFASWVDLKLLNEWKPEWKLRADAVASKGAVMTADGLISARKVRQPVEAAGDIANAFDGITYQKGSAVIAMFENYLGADVFRNGVQHYLAKHAWGNATTSDFLSALSTAAGRDIGTAFSTFLDQGGAPLIHVELNCNEKTKPVLRLTQERFLPLGSQGTASVLWQVPVCFAWSDQNAVHRECVLLTKKTDEFPLRTANGCPAWLMADANGAGYYRVNYAGAMMTGFQQLNVEEKVSFIQNAGAMFSAGRMPATEALAIAAQSAREPARAVVQAGLRIVLSVENLIPSESQANYARWFQSLYGARARELGWTAKPGDSSDTNLMRASLVPPAATVGQDAGLQAEASRLAHDWLKDRKAIAPDMVVPTLASAARHGDRAFFDALVAEALKSRSQRDRYSIAAALAAFNDPVLARAGLDLLLSGELDARELTAMLQPRKETQAILWDFVKENFDQLNAKLPGARGIPFGATLPLAARGFCDEKDRADVERFFNTRIADLSGGARNLNTAIESIRLCEARKSALEAGVVAFLRRY